MLIREYTPGDLDALRRMHARQGFDYAFPDLADPIFVSKLVVEDDHGRAVMASLARLTCEMYLLVDREDNSSLSSRGPSLAEGSLFDAAAGHAHTQREIPRPPRRTRNDKPDARGRAGKAQARWAQFLALHAAGEHDLLARGLDDAHAWLPPPIARRFGRRLESLGWVRDDGWTPYCRRLRPVRHSAAAPQPRSRILSFTVLVLATYRQARLPGPPRRTMPLRNALPG